MSGNNQIYFNDVTMNEAIQFYLNSVFLKARVKVLGVTRNSGSGIAAFVISITDPDDEEIMAPKSEG